MCSILENQRLCLFEGSGALKAVRSACIACPNPTYAGLLGNRIAPQDCTDVCGHLLHILVENHLAQDNLRGGGCLSPAKSPYLDMIKTNWITYEAVTGSIQF